MDDTLSFAISCGDNVGLLLDSWHWHHAVAGTAEILAAGRHILLVDVADSAHLHPADVRDDQRLLPGHGVIDLHAFFGALRSVDYSGPVTPEVFGYRHPGPPVDAARIALKATLSATRPPSHDKIDEDGAHKSQSGSQPEP
ncbi:TIM barrel protein [Parafrankia elaeagni]|uniref:TIM barrel protein n=1 Tax=Parafrankia elaeagni TaxID=222534 RepID=UPI000375AC21|nr:TIM barrel protein [Parafrankia elaeagni]